MSKEQVAKGKESAAAATPRRFEDITPSQILANLKEGKEPGSRKGSFTTGVLAVKEERRMALFFTGPNHAGENMAKLLEQRARGLSPPIQMRDALSRNVPKEFETLFG